MHKLLFILSTFIVVGLYIWMRPSSIGTPEQVHVSTTKTQTVTQETAHIKSIEKNTVPYQKEFPINIRNQGRTRNDIFEEEAIDYVVDKKGPIPGVSPVAALRMKTHSIQEIKTGDTLTLPSIEGNIYTLKIENHYVSTRGAVSVSGNFKENGNLYSAVLTEGNHTAFISMSTPEGNYEIQVEDGLGLVYASADIEQVRIDYHQNDQIDYH